MRRWLPPAAALLAAAPLAAQALWIVPAEFEVAPGQRVAVSFDGEAGRTPEPVELRGAALYTAQAAYNVVNLRREDGAVTGEATARGEGTLALGVCAGPGHTRCAKALLYSLAPGGPIATRPLGLRFEIVPETDPHRLRSGEVLAVRVLFEGNPAAGAELAGAVRTSADGKANVLPSCAGDCRITARRGEFTASLLFAAPGRDDTKHPGP